MNTKQNLIPVTDKIKRSLADSLSRLTNHSTFRVLRHRKTLWLLAPVIGAVSFMAISQSTAPSIPAVALSADPLYATTSGDKPALVLALSVEFPTVGAQYRGGNDYSNSAEYLGYYDAESCYTYNTSPTETPVSPQVISDFKRFDRAGKAIALPVADTTAPGKTTRMCWDGTKSYTKDSGVTPASNDAFSGNFLNWATSSAIDMLRLSLTGGDRSVDTDALTVLQRAFLPNGGTNGGGCYFNNGSYFPAKQLLRSGGSSGTAYFGAIPASMASSASNTSHDIWIANALNRIYFRAGSTSTGSCTDQSGYTLGTPTTSSASWISSTITSYTSKPSGSNSWPASPEYSYGDTITLTGVQEVLYGFTARNASNTNWKSAAASGVITCSEATFTNGSTNGNAKCYVRPNTTGETPPVSTSLSSDSFFYARVQVCNRNGAGELLDKRDYALCKKYPNGNYKSTGAIQKYSDQLRLAAFGYLMDQTASYNNGRYGGVLRAPIKYVGGKTFDITGTENTPTGGNPRKEWNENNGVFIVNPENDTTYGKSGVITYLNQFGRTGSTPGLYKQYDPVGELHYEALRYLQGLPPSTDAISNITSGMYDGFPALTTWTDPYGDGRSNTADYSCQKSNIVVVGDINTHDGTRWPTPSTTGNVPDLTAWRTVVQNFEKNASTTYLDGQGISRTTGNPNGANNSVPSSATRSQLMGSAYWAHTHDIRGTSWTDTDGPAKQRPGLRVKTFTFDVNEGGTQTNNTTRRTANQFFMASKYGGFEADPANTTKNPFNTWGNPFKREDGTIDKYVWEDTNTATSRIGEANTYYLQSDARGVLSAFDDIFARASTAARSIAGGAIQSKNLTQAGNTIYQGTFDTADWSGDLLAVPVTVSTSNTVTIGATPTWTAATQLAALSSPAASRNIVVGKVGATANPVATAFTWSAIEDSLKTALDKTSPSSAADGLAQDRLNYLRGERSKEANPFRTRNKLLGDIVNSGVVYSGAPTTSINSSSYASFKTTNAARTPAVFVGANDGMLHAFNATNGNELFGYIPSWLGPKLSALTNPTYVNSHQSYVDGTPAVAEAQVGSDGTEADWKTVLIGSTGAGGQGVFALDVTNPATFTASNVMWEFTHADDQDMGNVTGRPQILKMRTSAYNTTATYKWFAVVGSGLNNYVTDSAGLFSSTGKPALFLLDLSKPAGTAWTLDTNYYKVSLPINSTLSATKATGLINFRAALGASREVTQIFMGDLHGNLWKLDFSLLGVADWNINKLSSFNKGTISSPDPYPLFIAKDGSGNVQPITMAPSLIFGPKPTASYVVFGTGKYIETSDKGSTTQQSMYMVYDNGSSSGDTVVSPAVRTSAISGRGRLKAGTATASTGIISVPAFTLGRASSDTDSTQRSGWYADFPTSGERQISSASVFGNTVIFGSLIPGASGSSGGSCAAAGGGGYQYTVNIASGNGTLTNSTVGIMGEPLVGNLSNATSYTISDSTGRRTKTTTSQIIQQGSGGLATGGTTTSTITAGRLSWRQINNYQDLKNATP
jgi:type IV pilus assembly protein PilY1